MSRWVGGDELLQVKNKAPAAVQITAEQLLREAHERQEPTYKPPKQKITDGEELQEYRYVGRCRTSVGPCPPGVNLAFAGPHFGAADGTTAGARSARASRT